VAALREGDEGAVLTFSERVRLQTDWTSDAAALARTLDGLTASGATSLRDAIFAAGGLRQDARGRTLVVVFSDGADTTSWLDPITVLNAARDTDVVVYGVTLEPVVVARNANQDGVRQRAALRRWFDSDPTLFPDMLRDRVTEDTGGEMLHVASARELAGAFERIIGEFKSRYLLSYSPQGVPESGWHRLEVKLRGRSGTVIARRGYVK
jgi:VWFA-related protein